MAINFLNSVDFNKNELLNPTIENQPNDTAAGTGVEGQLYFNTTDDILKVYANGAWVEVGGGVTSLTTTDGTYINLTPNSATTGAVTVTADLSAVDGTASVGERYLTKSNTWATVASIPGTYTWGITADSGNETINSGDDLEILGTTYISTAISNGPSLEISHDLTSRSDTTSTPAQLAYGGTFNAATSVTTNSTGHVTGINVATYQLPASDDNYVDSLAFNTGDGILTAGRTGTLPDLTVDLDGRYQLAGSYDNYQQWQITDGTQTDDVTTDAIVKFVANSTPGTAGAALTGSGTTLDPYVVTHTFPNDDNYVDSISFDTGSGVLTLGRTGALADLTQDLDGRYLTANETITLTGEVTGSGTTSISTTVANGVLDVANFNASAIVTASEGIENNNTDTTIPTSAAVKAYADSLVVGGLIYQGGYNAATNTPNLDGPPSPNNIKKGWTYTVTADGSFFTEQVRVGDVLIAESDAPTTLADWTTVQNNVDLASLTQVGIGNVNAGTGIGVAYSSGTATVTNTGVTSLVAGDAIDVSASTGSVTVSVEDSTASNKGAVIVAGGTGISVAYNSGTATVTNTDTNSSNTDTGQITAGSTSGTVTHNFGTTNVIVQTYLDNATDNYPTVFCDITRASNSVTATIASAETDDIIILVQKIG